MLELLNNKHNLTKKPLFMGILNVTPDSFSDGGKYLKIENAIKHAKELLASGVNIIDIGGESTRPGAKCVLEEEELRRIIPIIEWCRDVALQRLYGDFLISIDTYKSKVAKVALKAGANMINDVSGLTMDSNMVKVVRDENCPIVIMHNKGIPATKPVTRHCEEHSDEAISLRDTLTDCFVGAKAPPRNDVIARVYTWLKNQTDFAISNDIKKENVIIDPGIGFGKTPEEDLFLIENLNKFKSLGFPILVGPSKKSFIRKLFPNCDLEIKSKEIIKLAIKNGASIVRVHNLNNYA